MLCHLFLKLITLSAFGNINKITLHSKEGKKHFPNFLVYSHLKPSEASVMYLSCENDSRLLTLIVKKII